MVRFFLSVSCAGLSDFWTRKPVFPVAPFRHEGGSSAPIDLPGMRLECWLFPLWSLGCPCFTRNHWRILLPADFDMKCSAEDCAWPFDSGQQKFHLSSFYAVLSHQQVLERVCISLSSPLLFLWSIPSECFFFTLNFIISSSNFEELLGKAVPCSYVLCWAPSHRGVPRLARNHWGPWPSLFLPSE